MLEPLILTVEQDSAVSRMVAEPTRSALNASIMGAGKSVMGVTVCQRLGAKIVLVIAPLGTRVGWEQTFKRQGVELPFKWIANNKTGKANLADYQWEVPGIYFVGVELFARWGWDKEKKHAANFWNVVTPDIAIFDEVHRAKSRSSQTSKVLVGTWFNKSRFGGLDAGFKLAMSGTPAGNTFPGFYPIVRWLWPEREGAGDIADKSPYRWIDTWCATVYDKFAPNNKRVVAEKVSGRFVASLPCYVRLEPPVGVDLVEETRWVDLSPKQRKLYDQLESDLVAWLDNESPLVVEVPIALRIRARQMTLGTPIIRDDGVIDFEEDCDSSKLDELENIIEELDGESALIFTDSAKFAKVAAARIEKWGHAVARWDGTVPGRAREVIKDQFISGKVRFLVAVIPALAEGVDKMQHATRNVIWLSKSDSGILGEQALARVLRQGQTKTVRSISIAAVDTYDSGQFSGLVQAALQRKQELAIV